MCAGAQNISTVVAGQFVYTLGNAGITFCEPSSPVQDRNRVLTPALVNSLLIADITSLQWRAFVNGAVNLPYVLNAFVAGYITSGINAYSQDGWRWGVSVLLHR